MSSRTDQLETQIKNPWIIQRQYNQIYFANKFLTSKFNFQMKNGWVLPLVYGCLLQFEIFEKKK